MHINKIHPSLPFCRLDSPRSLSISSYDRCSSPFIILVGLDSLRCAHVSPVLGSIALDPACRAEQRGRITLSDMLSTLILLQTRGMLAAFAVRVHFWLMVSWACTRTPGPLLQSCLPALTCAGAYSSPDTRCMECRWEDIGSRAAGLASVRNPSSLVHGPSGQTGASGPCSTKPHLLCTAPPSTAEKP